MGISPFTPYKRNSTGQARGSAIYHRLFLYFQLHREKFDRHYHERSNVEAAFGAVKAKFGETLKSKLRIAEENELLDKVTAHNITVLIHGMFGHGVVPEFLTPNKPERLAPTIRLSPKYAGLSENPRLGPN